VYEKLKEGIARGEFKYIQLFFKYYYGKHREFELIDLKQYRKKKETYYPEIA
jgi:hypothetical protein